MNSAPSRHKQKTGTNDAIIAAAFQQHYFRQIEDANQVPGLARLERLNRRPPPRARPVRSVVDSGLDALRKKPKAPVVTKKEKVIDQGPQVQPTLAQRLGLVPAPPQPLSENEWARKKEACVQRGDPNQPCPICHDDFGTSPTILLSCTHLFHRACLDAFERFSGKKTCPLCRRKEYQKRIVFEGETAFLTKCATTIQAFWRGYRARRWYRSYRRHHPPKDPRLKQRWSEQRLSEITDRAVASVDALRVDSFLEDLDGALAMSRRVFDRWDRRKLGPSAWEAVMTRAVSRGETECAICLCSLDRGTTSARAGADQGRVLLSCSHLLHARCLDTLEQMASECGSADLVCPICRAAYTKHYPDRMDGGTALWKLRASD